MAAGAVLVQWLYQHRRFHRRSRGRGRRRDCGRRRRTRSGKLASERTRSDHVPNECGQRWNRLQAEIALPFGDQSAQVALCLPFSARLNVKMRQNGRFLIIENLGCHGFWGRS